MGTRGLRVESREQNGESGDEVRSMRLMRGVGVVDKLFRKRV